MQSFGATRAFGKAFERLCGSAAIIIRQFMVCTGFFVWRSSDHNMSVSVGKKLRNQPQVKTATSWLL